MKRLTPYIIVIFLLLGLWNCQPILKAPAATILSATLPTPEIDSTESVEELPIADFNLHVKGLNGEMINMADYRGKVIFLNFTIDCTCQFIIIVKHFCKTWQ